MTKTCDSSDYTDNILFMNLNRTYEGNKSDTIFVAKKLELKGVGIAHMKEGGALTRGGAPRTDAPEEGSKDTGSGAGSSELTHGEAEAH